MNYLERAKHWELKAKEWFCFIQNTKLTASEYNSAWAYMRLCLNYEEKNRTQHRLL